MGMCFSCCGEADDNNQQPDPEVRRQMMAEAAERRKIEMEARGVRDPEALKRKQQRREEIEKQAETNGDNEAILKWQAT